MSTHQTTRKTGHKRDNLIIGASWAADNNEYKEDEGTIRRPHKSHRSKQIVREDPGGETLTSAIVFCVKLSCKYAFELWRGRR